MKRKILTIVFSILAALACVLTLVACDGWFSGAGSDVYDEGGYSCNHEYPAQSYSRADENSHWKVCDECYKEYDRGEHEMGTSGECAVCGYIAVYTPGLEYRKSYMGGWEYDVCGKGDAVETDIIIPSYHDGWLVTSIDYDAFRNCDSLTSIVIPNSVTDIGGRAFYGCSSLTSIEIPDSVEDIRQGAFSDTAYYNNESNWVNGVLYIGKHLIEAKKSISGAYAIKQGTIKIADNAFENCSDLTNIEIPNSVTSIGEEAFKGCSSLTSIEIPDSVTSICDDAFTECSGLTSATIGNGVTSIGYYAFKGCSSLTSIEMRGSGASIGNRAFSDTAYYEDESNWDNGVLYIGKHLIEAKPSVAGSYVVKQGTCSIASFAFYNCSSLTSIEIPNSVTNIEFGTFRDCNSLTSITLPFVGATKDKYTFLNYIFGGDGSSDDVVPKSLREVIITDAASIGYVAFRGCDSLTSITIPNSVTSIGEEAFKGCSGLTSIEIPDSVTIIGDFAFLGCSSLTSIEIPNSVTSVGRHAFAECSGLTSITIGNSVTSIGEDAFAECSGLASVTIGNSITSIGNGAFYNCSGLASIVYNGTKAQWKAIRKGWYWNEGTGNCIVICTDGTLPKSKSGK